MKQERKAYKLGELGRVVTGKTPALCNPIYFGDKYPFITPSDMKGQKYARTERSLSDEGASHLKSCLVPPNSVAVSCIGWQMGKAIMTDKPSITNQQLNTIVPNEKIIPDFLYYSLSLRRDELLSLGAGSGVRTPILNKTAFSELAIDLPPLEIQRSIASILSAYDDLIENNIRRIIILEEMARMIYREWFVNFRFPGHEKVKMVDSPLGMIPEGWEVRALQELICEHIGGGWGKDEPDVKFAESAWVIRGTDIPGARYCHVNDVPFRYHTSSNLKTRRLQVGDIVFEVSGGSKGQPVGRSLLITAQLKSAFGDDAVICASFCKRIQPSQDKYRSEILYLSFVEGYTSGEIEEYQVQSTGISNFKWTEYLQQTQRAVPSQEIQDQFCKTVMPMFANIATLGLKSANLRQTRDLLLPKLISGEVSVLELGNVV